MKQNLARIILLLNQNKIIALFTLAHVFFGVTLGRLYALAPDESGYLYTFNNLYGNSSDPNPQYNSGWITAPKAFLWIAYLPAKVITYIGVPDYLAIRFLSIALTLFSIIVFHKVFLNSKSLNTWSNRWIFLSYLIPSVFLWTTVGLRESFIIAELAAFLAGVNLIFRNKILIGAALISCGSYGLLSTKSYLWACLILASLISIAGYLVLKIDLKLILKFIAAAIVIPLALFASTTSIYALNFILQSDVSEVGQRSGDSVTQIYVDGSVTQIYVDGSGNSNGIGGEKPNVITGENGSTQEEPKLITFHGDFTLIALHFYLQDYPNSIFTKVFTLFKLKDRVEQIWTEKIKLGLIYEDSQIGADTSSLNGHILTPGKINKPLSLLWPAFVFLCGPFPFVGDPGLAAAIASFESPLWWALYLILIVQFVRFRKTKFYVDPPMILAVIFTLGVIAFSALVEVNLGTSFRHRSVLLVPIIFMFLRLRQRSVELVSQTPYNGPQK